MSGEVFGCHKWRDGEGTRLVFSVEAGGAADQPAVRETASSPRDKQLPNPKCHSGSAFQKDYCGPAVVNRLKDRQALSSRSTI